MKAGDTVRLKSGGPLMTIREQGQNGQGWECTWLNDKAEKFDRGQFPEVMLVEDDGTVGFA
jgi:uncharacterized protein YodC (DUF2158 family)